MSTKINYDEYKIPSNITIQYDPFILVRNNDFNKLKELLINQPNLLNRLHGFAGYNLLHRAAELGHTDMCIYLIKLGINPNSKTIRFWNTPLHLSLGYGHLDTSKAIILYGGNIILKNKDGLTPYEYAIKKGYTNIARELEYINDIKLMENNITNKILI